MQKLKCVIAYDGSAFSGFQIQLGKRTIQGEIEKALQKIHKGEHVRIHASGRTDRGVHALAQLFHFETSLMIEPDAWCRALQTLVPNDIEIKYIEKVDANFHARFDAIEKEYRYFILNRQERDVFRRNYVYHTKDKLDLERMQAACQVFVGTHDFTSFSSARSEVKGSKVRTLSVVTCEQLGEEIQFIIRGNGFLQHMVRIIVGAILDVGRGDLEITDLERILHERDRTKAGVTIPSEGLYLWEVKYENS